MNIVSHPKRLFSRLARLSLVLALLGAAPAGPAFAGPSPRAAQPPAEVSPSEWQSIQSQIRRAEYDYTWHALQAAYVAPNLAYGWQTTMGAGGATVASAEGDWRWGLALTAYGYAGTLQPVATLPARGAAGNRATYRWDANLTEWYVNSADGLEQGFTLTGPPAGRGSLLRLKLAYSGDLAPELSADGQATLFRDGAGQVVLRYGDLAVQDAAGRALPAHMDLVPAPVAGYELSLVVDDAAAVYPLIVDPLLTGQVAKLTGGGSGFGRSLAVSGDTLVVGSSYMGNSAQVFERNRLGADAWGHVTSLVAADAAAGDEFGCAVAISGDTIVVGAIGNDDAGSSSGSAYVFARNKNGAGQWGQVAKLTASDAAAEDEFGYAVAISGDTLVVGATGNDDAGSSSGSAYVFARNQNGADQWGQVAKLTASDAAARDYFGWSTAFSGDTLVVGAPLKFGAGSSSGSAYVFARNQNGADQWGQVTKLTASEAAPGDCFGLTVAIDGDTLVVGAYRTCLSPSSPSGMAYVFERNENGADQWGEVAKLAASDAAANDYFGIAVAISGDTLVVGACQSSAPAVNPGAAYLFERNMGGSDQWGQVAKLIASDAAAGDGFGFAVTMSGNTLAVGASGINGAYMFMRRGNAWQQIVKRAASDTAAGDQFGYAAGLNGDTLVVGAPDDADAGANSGSTYVLARNQTGADVWGEVKKLVASDAAANDYFGHAVAISGGILVIGAPGQSSSDQGAAYVFERNKNGADQWGQVAKLTPSDTADGGFGWSVAISGDTLVVGAPYQSNPGANAGAAYVFERNKDGADQWGQAAKLTASDAHAEDQFGWSAALDGDTLAVGAPQSSQAGAQNGAAYVFERNKNGADQWGQVARLIASDASDNDQLGYSLSLSGGTLVAGAPYAGVASGSGAAYVFERNEDGADAWGQTAKLTASDSTGFDEFGNSVAISRDKIIVGAPAKSDAGTYSGVIYVFERNYDPANPGVPNAGRWGQRDKLAPLDTAMGDLFGWSVAISGNALAAGARYDDNTGSATVYYLTTVSADLGLSKIITPASAAPGQAITYTLALSNSGGITATQVVLTDSVPVSVTVTGVVSSGAAITQVAGSGYVWQVQDLAPGQGGVITLSGVLSSPLRMGAFTNTAIAASEGNSGDIAATADVTVLNAAPAAQDDALATDEDVALSLPCSPPAMAGVLSNDADANGDTLQAVLAGDVATGTLSLYGCGGYAYQPAPDFNGVVTFTYRASDTLAFSNLAVVTITIVPVDDTFDLYLPVVLK